MIRSTCVILTLACAGPAHAATAQLSEAGANALHVWTEGLFDKHDGADATRLVGFEVSAGDRVELEGKAALHQTLDPGAATDGGYLAWSARLAPASLAAFGPHTTFALESAGQLDAVTGAYTQSIAGGLEWKPPRPLYLAAGVRIDTEFTFDSAAGSVALKSAPEWILDSRIVGGGEPMRTELKARLEYTGASNAAPSVFAGLVFEVKPE